MAAPEVALAVPLGGLAGLLAGWGSNALAARPARTDRLTWLLAGGGALALAVDPAARSGLPAAAVEAGLIGLLLLVLACDVRERAVYPTIVCPGVAFAAAVAPFLGTPILDALLGAVASAGVFVALYVLARLRYGPGALGAGDIFAAALLGAVVGLSRLPLALVLAGVIGVAIALGVGLRARSLHATFPYAPALCLAALAATLLRAS
jgi:prepilin signal peptidase PulO-like enzyme (type II secretory pathway)